MASTYVNDLRLNELGTGDGSGTWGTTTNTNLELIGEALGFGTEAISTNANTHTSTIADGSTDPARSMYIKYTGALDSDCTITIDPNTISRVHIIENATTDSGSSGPYNIIIKQGSGATVTIANGQVAMVYLDGAGSGAKVVNALTNLSATYGSLTTSSLLKVSADADADDVTGDSATGRLTIGAGEDLNLYHGGTNSYIVNDTGNLVIDTASLVLKGATPTLTIGDADAEDTKIVFDGNAQDFYVGLDDSEDDLVIGKGSALGTTPAISVDENLIVTVHNRAISGTIVDEGNSGVFDLADGNNFKATPTSTVSELTFSNPTAGQSGNVFFNNSAGAAVSAAHSAVAINAAALTSLSTAGVYFLTYYCTAGDSSANSILVSVSGALT
jgi:hypothetical protein